MKDLGRELIVGVILFVGTQLSNLCLAEEIQGSSGEEQFVKPPAGTSQPSMDQRIPVERTLIPIQEFVRQPFPAPLTFHFFKKIKSYAQYQNAVPELKKLLLESLKVGCKGENLERLCSNIVTTLGVLGSSEALSGIKDFLQEGGPESNFTRIAITDAVRALGVWVNVRERQVGEKEDVLILNVLAGLAQLTKIGLPKSDAMSIPNQSQSLSKRGDNQKTYTTKGIALSENFLKGLGVKKGQKLEHENENEIQKWQRRLRLAAIQGLGFSGSQKTFQTEDESKIKVKDFLEKLLSKSSVKSSFRAFMLEILSAHNIIARVGVDCYLEQEKDGGRSDECRARWAGKMKMEVTSVTDENVSKK